MYRFMPYKEIEKYIPKMVELGVSKVARSKGQFLDQYERYGASKLPDEWKLKRENFIKRHLVQYVKKPTERRRLALMAWAYLP